MEYIKALQHYQKLGKIDSRTAHILENFYRTYSEAVMLNGNNMEKYNPLFECYLNLIIKEIDNPTVFEPFHISVREPFDYYQWGIDLLHPLILFKNSKVLHLNYVMQMEEQLAKGENVILFANHQTEPDPQVISLLLADTHPKFAEEMIFVAGHRVISDPLAIPFSKGRNLLCIFSKKHILIDPEVKEEKLQHNARTMKIMSQLLIEGGKCIYVAPSGGRDRPNAEGKVEVAHFDPQSIEMFWLMAKQSERPTHFYPLALATYDLLPPPHSVEKDLGEHRNAKCTPVHLAFGKEIDMVNFPGSELLDKKHKRKARADYIWHKVKKNYDHIMDHRGPIRKADNPKE